MYEDPNNLDNSSIDNKMEHLGKPCYYNFKKKIRQKTIDNDYF